MTQRSKVAATIVMLVAVFSVLGTLSAQTPREAKKFVGVKACRTCHRDEEKGNQYEQWDKSAHAGAYKTLGTDQAKEVAKKKGLGDPLVEAACLKCHVTGAEHLKLEAGKWKAPTELFDRKFKFEDGVQCETCHGPGSAYSDMEVMKDHAASVAAGMIVPNKDVCVKCHNEESPSFKEFKYEEMFKKIAHPNPQNKK